MRMSASGPGRTEDDRNEEGTSELAVTAGRVARSPGSGRSRARARAGAFPRAWGTIRPAPSAAPDPAGDDRHHHEEHPTPMTSRPRPSQRPRTWDLRERRSMLLNLGFGITIVLAVLLLVVAAGASWYGDHLASAATVNGTSISKDAWNKQMAVNAFRAAHQDRRIGTLLAAGRLPRTDADTRMALLQQQLQQTDSVSLEQLVDGQ